MKRPALEVADVFRQHQAAFLAKFGSLVSKRKLRVISAICLCRTGQLGGHLEKCGSCGHRRFFYNSCRNRHCPKCQWSARTEWLDKRRSELLDCPYFHVVFTLPGELNELVLYNRGALLHALFQASAATLKQIAADPRHLGAAVGFLSVLHTWGQRLQFHPHVHCIVPGGGLAPDRQSWVASRPSFFLPVRVLSRRFRTLCGRLSRTASCV